MDDRMFKAWKDIADRCNDPTAVQTISMTRATLKELFNEIARLREELETEFEIGSRLAEELSHWGWGDMHYGDQPQETRVSALVDEYRALHLKEEEDDPTTSENS